MVEVESRSHSALGSEEVSLHDILAAFMFLVLVVLSVVSFGQRASSCSACDSLTLKTWLPAAGIICYSVLSLMQFTAKARKYVLIPALACAGVHVVLASQLISQGVMCWLCLSTAIVSVCAAGVLLMCKRGPIVAPLGACAIAIIGAHLLLPVLWPAPLERSVLSRLNGSMFTQGGKMSLLLLVGRGSSSEKANDLSTLLANEYSSCVDVKWGTLPDDLRSDMCVAVVGYSPGDAVVVEGESYFEIRAEVIKKLRTQMEAP